jgi:hypothetical protein
LWGGRIDGRVAATPKIFNTKITKGHEEHQA